MSTVLDASALLAILRDEAGAQEALSAAADAAITAVNFAEVRDQVVRAYRDRSRAAAAVDGFIDRRLSVLPCDHVMAARAADLRSDHYRRRGQAVSLADCFAIAAAEAQGALLVTSDQNQAAVARAVGVEVHGIPNSAGVWPDR